MAAFGLARNPSLGYPINNMPVAAPHKVKKWKTKHKPPYNVVLLDDQEHTYAYVIEMLCSVIHCDPVKAFLMASEVDSAGRVIVFTGAFEQAELKRDLIHGYGGDPRMPKCQGSMSAELEPAPGA